MPAIKFQSLREVVRSRSPWCFFGSVGLAIFVAEVIVMVVLSHLPQLPTMLEAVIDGACLSVLVAPALYYLLYLPLKRENRDRQLATLELRRSGEILQAQAEQLFEYSQTLEQQVTDRTEALSAKNVELEALLTTLHSTQAQIVQSEKMSSLGQLVAGVAHEINNPASFIHGNLTHLRQYTAELFDLVQAYETAYPIPTPAITIATANTDIDFLREDLPKLLSSMHNGTDRIRQIVLSLRNFSRLDEAGIKAVDLHQGLDSSLMLLQHRLKEQDQRPAIQVIKHYGPIAPVECAAGSINQVFLNLLSNAIDAIDGVSSQDTLPTLTIVTSQLDPSTVVMTIADNGSGIATAIQSKLFDPFFTTKPVGQGQGLGLSTSYQIVTVNHGGKLWFESTPGHGAKFVIELPIVAVSPSSPIRTSATR
jgi:signal transduction histidine kinase